MLEPFENGEASIKDLRVDQCMHSKIGAAQEARLIYIEASQLEKRLSTPDPSPLVLYDVGLGIGANALEAVDLFLRLTATRGMRLVSFENDLNGMRAGLSHFEKFPFLQKYRVAVEELLSGHSWGVERGDGAPLTWELKEGDFKHHLANCPAPEVIYYDMFSPRVSPELWTKETFELLFQSTAPLRAQGRMTTLHTYSSASRVKRALHDAGFLVSKGPETSAKRDTILAQTLPFR